MSVDAKTAGLLLALIAIGCQPDVTCPETGTACGGDPVGTWNVQNACRDPVFSQPIQTTYLGQPVEMARQPAPIATSSDWCSALFVGPTAITSFKFPHDTLAVSGGQITYAAADAQDMQGTFQAVINTAGSGSINLSPTCLERSGAAPTCDMVAQALSDFAAIQLTNPQVPCSDSPNEPASCQFYYSYGNIACTGNLAVGCQCTYQVSFAGTVAGVWNRSGSILTHSDSSKMLPSQADYCVDGASHSLSLWGHDRTSILNQTGVRTLQLQSSNAP